MDRICPDNLTQKFGWDIVGQQSTNVRTAVHISGQILYGHNILHDCQNSLYYYYIRGLKQSLDAAMTL